MGASVVARRARTAAEHVWIAAQARRWPDYSRLFLVGDGAPWVISEEVAAIDRQASRLGLRVAAHRQPVLIRRQAVFQLSQFSLLEPGTFAGEHRLAVAFYHGRPTTEEPVFTACHRALRYKHGSLARVQVSHAAMRDLVLESGIAPDKVFLIPIGVDPELFSMQTPDTRRRARERFGVPPSAVVVGSFQKDGVGWSEGFEPKLVKGPDLFLKTIAILQEQVPDLFVLLSGPARGYVKTGLEALRVPYRHVYAARYADMNALYQALDVYLVTSREEGGPKAVLEAMASGVPLVSTRVGQATDLVHHARNGWLADVGDVEALATWTRLALEQTTGKAELLARARQTAETNAYDAQLTLWRDFFKGFVES